MLFGRKKTKKAEQELQDKYNAFQNSFENNYKDLAMIHLKEYGQMLDEYKALGKISEDYYKDKKGLVSKKQAELKNFNHRQHIGW